jgi:hypothetical protein
MRRWRERAPCDPEKSSRWREIKYQYTGALGSVATIKNVSPRDSHGSFDLWTFHKCCRCTPEFRASDDLRRYRGLRCDHPGEFPYHDLSRVKGRLI